MIIDTSAIISLAFNEPTADWVEQQIARADRVLMSTVNLAETLIVLRARKSSVYDQLRFDLFNAGFQFVAPDAAQAEIAANARSMFPLNFGDCFAYALAKSTGLPLLTLDADFRKTDILVVSP